MYALEGWSGRKGITKCSKGGHAVRKEFNEVLTKGSGGRGNRGEIWVGGNSWLHL